MKVIRNYGLPLSNLELRISYTHKTSKDYLET